MAASPALATPAEGGRFTHGSPPQAAERIPAMGRYVSSNSVSDLVADLDRDQSLDIPGTAPNFGQYVTPHMLTFQTLLSSIAKVYRPSDEALRNSWEAAIAMRNDCGIMESLEARQRACALLDWDIVPEEGEEKDPQQQELCSQLKRIVRRISRFTEYQFNAMHAIWYGRYGISHQYNWDNVGGTMRLLPKPPPGQHDSDGWQPINGDKLVFRYDDGEKDSGRPAGQLGIRVSSRFRETDQINQHWRVEKIATAYEPTSFGMAYFLSPMERQTILVHKHTIEDGDFYSSDHSGSLHGVGIRSRIYWDWFQKQECLAFLMEYLERSAGGIEIWDYPAGNAEAKAAVEKAATERVSHGRNILINPKPPGEDAALFGVQIVEPGMAGIESLKDLLITFFGHRIKRYILGQVGTSESEASGLGSGVADLHLDTFLQIVKYDSNNRDETMTRQLVRMIQIFNFPQSMGMFVRFKSKTEDEDVDKRLESLNKAWGMGARIRERDVHECVGVSAPTADDIVLPSQQQSPAGGFPGQPQAPGVGGAVPGQSINPMSKTPVGSPLSHADVLQKRDDLRDAVRNGQTQRINGSRQAV